MKTDRSAILALFLFLLALYVAFAGDRYSDFQASDEFVMFQTTRALVEKLSPAALRTPGSLRPDLPETYRGQEAKYGLGQSLAALPMYLLARAIAGPPPGRALAATDRAQFDRALQRWQSVAFPLACATNALICAAVGAAFFVVARRLGYGRRASLAGALVVGTATIVAPYSRTFFSAPLVALSLLGAVGALAGANGRPPAARAWLWTGGWLALAILTRIDNVLLVPVFLAALWLGVAPDERREALRRTLSFAVPLVLVAVLIAWTNWLRGGEPGSGGYSGEGFSTLFATGVFGLLLSPARGVLWFSPPIAVALFYAVRFHRRHQRVCFVVFATAAVKLLLFAKWWNWFGGWSPGSRFLLPVVPLVSLMLLEPFSRWANLRRMEKAVIAAVVAAGIVVQVSCLLVAPNAYHSNVQFLAGSKLLAATGKPQPIADREQLLQFSPPQSPLVGNWTLIANGEIDWFGLRFGQYFPPSMLIGVLVVLAIVFVFAGAWLARIWLVERTEDREAATAESAPEPPGTFPPDRQALPAVVSRAAWILVILNLVVLATLALVIRANGLTRTDRLEYADGRVDERHGRDGSIYVRNDLAVEPGLAAKTIAWQGYLETPNWGEYTFYALVWGAFDLQVANREVLHNPPEAAAGRRSMREEVVLPNGIHALRLTYQAPLPESPRPGDRVPELIQLYWTTPGGGEYQHVIGRAWLYPTLPGSFRRLVAQLWRVKMGLPIVSILALWWVWIHALFRGRKSQRTEESRVAQTTAE